MGKRGLHRRRSTTGVGRGRGANAGADVAASSQTNGLDARQSGRPWWYMVIVCSVMAFRYKHYLFPQQHEGTSVDRHADLDEIDFKIQKRLFARAKRAAFMGDVDTLKGIFSRWPTSADEQMKSLPLRLFHRTLLRETDSEGRSLLHFPLVSQHRISQNLNNKNFLAEKNTDGSTKNNEHEKKRKYTGKRNLQNNPTRFDESLKVMLDTGEAAFDVLCPLVDAVHYRNIPAQKMI